MDSMIADSLEAEDSDVSSDQDGADGSRWALPDAPFLTLSDALVLSQCSSKHALQIQRCIVQALVMQAEAMCSAAQGCLVRQFRLYG